VNTSLHPPDNAAVALPHVRLVDFVRLGKPELTLLSVLTAVGGAFLAQGSFVSLVHTFVGTILVGGGAGALNMLLERDFDALMKRTSGRPIPGGRIAPPEAALFGIFLSVLGVLYLLVFTSMLAALLATVTLITYLFLYTPLKRLTPFATVVGAVPGALPPLIGWSAVRGEITIGALSLFAILFFWQMPHFLSLAWMYRKDYERGGFKMMTVMDATGAVTARQILVYSIGLIPASLLPTYAGLLGTGYFLGAGLLSITFLTITFPMLSHPDTPSARRLFFASLAYLPSLTLLMVLDRI
jgi:protoheme IX farnesyltransferase